ncbi:MAG: hypothetical protein GXP48_06880 [Acidobacteria bacterium]|nr:hypothetical protein [Acidobacteriota bacterium]
MDLPLIARVECRSDTKGEERPVAVWIAGERFRVTHLARQHLRGPMKAGAPAFYVATATLRDGRQVKLERKLPGGPWRVFAS